MKGPIKIVILNSKREVISELTTCKPYCIYLSLQADEHSPSICRCKCHRSKDEKAT